MDTLLHAVQQTSSTHAYVVRSTQDVRDTVQDFLISEKKIDTGSPDLYSIAYETLGIDDARQIAQYASLRPLGEKKFILVYAARLTTEAQSALLKVLEEGSGHSVFFFIVPPGVPLLETLLSRCVVVREHSKEDHTALGKEFLKLSYAERLKKAEKFGKESDREGARTLVRSLLALASDKKFTQEKLRDLLDADRYLQLSGSSPKGVIGHLALVL